MDGLERRPRGQTPTGDDVATCHASGNEPMSHAIAGSRSPGHERPAPVFTPDSASRAASGAWARIESDGLERRPRGQTPTGDDAASCLASGNEPISHAIAGSRAQGRRACSATGRSGAAWCG